VSSAAAQKLGVLPHDDVEKLMPATVFFRGQSAPLQMRNAAGVRFAGGGLLLTGLVDTSGYASEVQERYQAYLLLDTAAVVAGHTMAPGAYGIGFVKPDQFVVMDLSGTDLFVAPSTRDEVLRRPTPLQILEADGAKGVYRVYAGRNYVTVVGTNKPGA